MSPVEILIISLAVFGSAMIKNGVGVGAGIFLLPILTLVLPPKLALGLGAPAMLISDIVGVKNYWLEWDKKELSFLIPFAALGVIFGSYIIDIIPDYLFKQIIGAFAIGFSSMHIIKTVRIGYTSKERQTSGGQPKRFESRPFVSMLCGFLGGFASTVAHAGGLMMSFFMFQKNANSRIFVGTLVFFFALTNLFKIGAYMKIGIITSQVMLLVASLSPMIILGGLVGNRLNKRIPQKMFRLVILLIIFFIGLRLLWKA
ncbi:MAG: sulfite exporter TauE/SafE family protein [Desulfotignum sp.]|nr:sulfite exporter TauE/SafE family protein [Desulfotignum sp.]MCF8086818.1 sulfite exporter TauE/SafE family protein [Desulfotignum sp.]MCF8136767.1 sulfite exporter TauE/SafE family protein [Desulfotignum sp.]